MARTPLSQIEERNKIELEYMHCKNNVTVSELAKKLSVSEITIRRDLNHLIGEKMVQRSSSGRYSLYEDPSFDVELFKRYSANHVEKVQIARTALSLIHDGETIGIDSSTTTLELGKILHSKNDITVVTNNLFIPSYLCSHPSIHTFIAGGAVYMAQNSTEGAETCRNIESFHYDVAVISADYFDFEQGLSNTDYLSVDSKISFVEHADRCIALLDHTKIGKIEGRCFLPVSKIDMVITDSGITSEQIEMFSRSRIPLTVAD